jgi:hypothetical protein
MEVLQSNFGGIRRYKTFNKVTLTAEEKVDSIDTTAYVLVYKKKISNNS